MKKRHTLKRRRATKRQGTRRQRGGSQICYGKKGKTWSCSAECGENGDCKTFD